VVCTSTCPTVPAGAATCPVLPSTHHGAASRGPRDDSRGSLHAGAGARSQETATGTWLDHPEWPRGRPTRHGQGPHDGGQGHFSPGGGGGPPSNPLYLNHLWSYRETESATAFLAPRRPINHKTPDPGVFRCHFRGWDRRVLASPYKKCYVCGVLGDAGRCGVWVRTRKFGGYMKGKDERKVVKHDCSSGRVFQSKCLEPASPWFGLVKAGLARRSASAQPSTAGWP
jgi:hypothetical protein